MWKFFVCLWRSHNGGRSIDKRRLYSCRWLAAFCFWHIRLSHISNDYIHYDINEGKSQWSKNDTFFLFLSLSPFDMNIEQVVFFRPLDGTYSLNTKLFFSLYRLLLLLLLLCPDCALCLYHWDGKSIHLTNNIFTIEALARNPASSG